MTIGLSRFLSVLMVIILCLVITAAFGYQFLVGLSPCPMCFLQRACMIGVAGGQLLNFRFGIQMFHHGISIFHCVVGGATALRQSCLHICQKMPLVGTPVFGISLYNWSFIVFVCSVIIIGFLLMLYNPNVTNKKSKAMKVWEGFAALYLLAITFADIVAAMMICGFGLCPDS